MDSVKISSFYYLAINDGGSTWMVRRYTHQPLATNDLAFTESLVDLETSDPMAAIQFAIARNSWA